MAPPTPTRPATKAPTKPRPASVVAKPAVIRVPGSRAGDAPSVSSGLRAAAPVRQPRTLERVAPQPAAERLEGEELLRRDVAQVDVRTEPQDEVPLLGSERRLPEDAAGIAHAPEEGLDLRLFRQPRRVVDAYALAGLPGFHDDH